MEKKITLSLRRCLLLAGTLALVSSCQDYEPFSDQQIQDVAYTHEFEKQFGEIDPRQDWDLFGQLARHIGPVTRAGGNQSPTITLLDSNADTLHISPSQHRNYRLFLPELDIPSNTYENSNLGQVTQDFLTTAHSIKLCPMHWTTSANDEIGIYWYVDEEEYDDQGNEITKTIMGKDEHMYYIKELPIITGTHKKRIELETVYNYQDGNGNVAVRTSLDGVFSIAEVFTPENQWSSEHIVDQYLVSHPIQIDIPDNISEYGFWIRNMDGSGQRYSEWKLNNKIDGPIEADPSHRMSYTATFNINGLDLEGNGTKVWDPSQYLCFEDWMNYSDADLNDLVFIARGLDETNIKDNNFITENALLVCEDLSKFDFDFNDVVLDLTYKEEDDRTYKWVQEQEVETPWGTQKIAAHWEVISSEAKTTWLYVTPMAAGGAYETDVYFGQLPATKGEIHALMQETGWNNNPLEHAIINAGATFQNIEGVQTIGEQISMGYVWNVGNGQGQYATHLSQLFAEGYIRLHCKRDDKDATKIITSGTIKTDKNQSTAPQMMLLPKFFEWPQEYVHITEAYTGFSDWVSDITKTSWILDTQVGEKVTDRGDLKPDNPQEAVDPTLIEGVSVPFHGGQFIYINPEDETDTYTYNNGVFISLAGIQELLVSNDAKATVIVHFASKPANIYFDDANGNLLVYDKFGDDLQHTTYYTFSAKRFNQAVQSGGMWLLQDEDRPLNVTAVEIEIIGATSPDKRHNLVVSPISMTFDEIGQTMAITATSSTGANFSYSSTDATVATVTMDNGVPTVHATGEGNCQIIVTAVAGNGYHASVERITVVVDRTPTMPLTVGEPSWHDNITEGGGTYYYIYHRELTTYADLSGWANGASITFHYEGYDWAGTARNFFRVLSPNGTVIAGDFTSYDSADGDVTYTISAANLASCRDNTTGEYKFTIQYTDWDFNGTPNITSASVTKIAN